MLWNKEFKKQQPKKRRKKEKNQKPKTTSPSSKRDGNPRLMESEGGKFRVATNLSIDGAIS